MKQMCLSSQPPESFNYRCVPPHLTSTVQFINHYSQAPGTGSMLISKYNLKVRQGSSQLPTNCLSSGLGKKTWSLSSVLHFLPSWLPYTSFSEWEHSDTLSQGLLLYLVQSVSKADSSALYSLPLPLSLFTKGLAFRPEFVIINDGSVFIEVRLVF